MPTADDLQADKCLRLAEWCKVLIDQFPNADSGLAHVVVSDFNFDTCFVEGCLAKLKSQVPSAKHSKEEIAATIELLNDILTVPEDDRLWPENKILMDGLEDEWDKGENARRAEHRHQRIEQLAARHHAVKHFTDVYVDGAGKIHPLQPDNIILLPRDDQK